LLMELGTRPEELFAAMVPPEVIEGFTTRLAGLGDEILAAVRDERPEYSSALVDSPALAIKLGIDRAMRDFTRSLQNPNRPLDEASVDVYRQLGRAEMRAGRSLDSVRAAFEVGSRVTWRRVAALCEEAGLPAPGVAALAEAVFSYAYNIAAEVAEGHARARFDVAGERERQRRRLAGLLLDPEGSDPSAIERVAALSDWQVPAGVAVVAIAAGTHRVIAPRLDADVLAGMDRGGSWLIIPDPEGPGRVSSLRQAVRDVPAAVGLPVAPAEAWRSLRWARLTLGLMQRGLVPDDGPTRMSDHLATVLVQQDTELARAFACSRLAALDCLPPIDRERLAETLCAWLEFQRHAPSVAQALHIHPQTVRYRVAQLRELLGDVLDTPEGRFELGLALRATKNHGGGATSGGDA
jgi:PucR-like helix-turn-helix protein